MKPPHGSGTEVATRWTFGNGTHLTFDDHISRSVPHYGEGHDLVLALSDFFVRERGTMYELGCSTGTLTRRLAARHADRSARIVGLDIEPEMVDAARERCADQPNAELVLGDVRAFAFDRCDFVVSYYTLQFLSRTERLDVIREVARVLPVGGAFVLFEKVREADGQRQDLMVQLYADFKLSRGLTPAEILGKTQSLRAVLEPQLSHDNLTALVESGFGSAGLIHKSLCFEGYLAVR